MDGIYAFKHNADSLKPKPQAINQVGQGRNSLALLCWAGSGSRCQQQLTKEPSDARSAAEQMMH